MKARSLISYIIVSILVIILLSTAAQAIEYREVKAEEILKQIENGEDVNYTDCRIVGELNTSNITLKTVPNPHYYELLNEGYDKEIFNLSGPNENLCVIESNITIRNSIFEDSFNFSDILFNNSVNFNNASFNYSNNSEDLPDTDFRSTYFNNYADFTDVTFNNYAVFTGANFNNDAYFSYVKFNSYANFEYAKFNSYVDFREVSTIGPAYFDGARFNYFADFSGANFNDQTIFDGANFNGSKLPEDVMDDSNSSEDITDENVIYYIYSADFSAANFNNEVRFDFANFNSSAIFAQSTFNGSAYFTEVNFNSDADFTETKFESDADLWGPKTPDKIITDGKSCEVFLKSYESQTRYEDADIIYYNYRKSCQEQKQWNELSKWSDILSWVTCGYGLKPLRILWPGVVIVGIFACLYWLGSGIYRSSDADTKKSEVSFWDGLYFSINTFTTLGSADWYPKDNFRKWVTLEGLCGWTFLGIFMATLANILIR